MVSELIKVASDILQQSENMLVVEFDTFAAGRVDHATTVRAPLLLVLLLGEAFAPCDDQVGVRAVCIVIRHVLVAGKTWIDTRVGLDSLKAVLYVILLLGLTFCGG